MLGIMRWVVCVTLLSVAPLAQSVHVVDSSGAGDFTELQAAVDAAADGDVLLFRTGSYAGGSVNGKGLVLLADTDAAVRLESSLALTGLPESSTLVLSGLELDPVEGLALDVQLCAGAVWIEQCVLSGGGADALHALLSPRLVFVDSVLFGGIQGLFFHGRDAARFEQSSVWAFGTQFVGHAGMLDDPDGGDGGTGALFLRCDIVSAGSTFDGANGAAGSFTHLPCCGVICGASGSGGHGLFASYSTVQLLDTTLSRGFGGGSPGLPDCSPPQHGLALESVESSVTRLRGERRELLLPRVLREGASFELGVPGPTTPGAATEQVWLLIDGAPRPAYGRLPLAVDPAARLLHLGSVGVGTSLELQLEAPTLPPSFPQARAVFLQAVLGTGATLRATYPKALTLLDAGL